MLRKPKAPEPSQFQKDAEARQTAELATLKDQEGKRKAAAGRKSRGRASLISGSELGSEEE